MNPQIPNTQRTLKSRIGPDWLLFKNQTGPEIESRFFWKTGPDRSGLDLKITAIEAERPQARPSQVAAGLCDRRVALGGRPISPALPTYNQGQFINSAFTIDATIPRTLKLNI